MTPERWEQIKVMVRSQFEVLDEYTEDLEPGNAEVLEFVSPAGQLKVSFITRPKVTDKKTNYSHRVGSDVKVDYVFSDTEQTHHLEVQKWNEAKNSWDDFSTDGLF